MLLVISTIKYWFYFRTAAFFTVLVSTMFFFNWESTKSISYYILHTRFVADRKIEVGKFIYQTLTCGIHFWTGFDVS